MRRLLFFGAVIFPMIAGLMPSATGQSITYMTSLPSQHSIVREYLDSVYIVYSYDGGTKHHFWYVDRATNNEKLAEITFSNPQLQVEDMRIEEHYLFICGRVGTVATAGYLDIHTTFVTGTDTMLTLMLSNNLDILKFKRMDVVNVGGGDVHLVMVGESYSAQYDVPTRCIADMSFHCPGRTVIDCRYTQEETGVYYYDDIKATTSMVVVAGHKNGSNALYMHAYPKPANLYNFIFDTGMHVNTYQFVGWTQHRPVCDVRLEHLGSDSLATLYYTRRMNGTDTVYGLSIDVFHSIKVLVYQGFIRLDTLYPAAWELKEACYVRGYRELYVLQNTAPFGMPYGQFSLRDYLYRFSINTLPSAVGVYDVLTLPRITSMGRIQKGDAVVLSGADLRLARFTGGNRCAAVFSAPMITEPLGMDKSDYEYRVEKVSIGKIIHGIVLTPKNSSIICAE